MDVWAPGGTSKEGHRYVLAFVDAYTKFVVAAAAPDHTAETISRIFMERLVAVHGPPEVLVSDGAPEFVGNIQSELYKGLGVIRKVISPYHPQANGQVERIFRTIRPMLAIIIRQHPEDWAEYLPLIIYAYNTAYHESIRNTPFFLVYGRDPAPGDTDFDPSTLDSENSIGWLERLKWTRGELARNLQQAHEKNKIYYDRNIAPRHYDIGDLVFVKNVAPKRDSFTKLQPRFVGPYRVVDKKWDTLYIRPVRYPQSAIRRIHVNLTKPCDSACVFEMPREELEQPFLDPSMVDPNLEPEAE